MVARGKFRFLSTLLVFPVMKGHLPHQGFANHKGDDAYAILKAISRIQKVPIFIYFQAQDFLPSTPRKP